jgi:hypothetical protein
MKRVINSLAVIIVVLGLALAFTQQSYAQGPGPGLPTEEADPLLPLPDATEALPGPIDAPPAAQPPVTPTLTPPAGPILQPTPGLAEPTATLTPSLPFTPTATLTPSLPLPTAIISPTATLTATDILTPTETPALTLTVTATVTTTLPLTATVLPDDAVTFEQLGFTERALDNPFGGISLLFGLPADWELTEGAAVQLNVATLFDSTDLSSDSEDASTTPTGCPMGVYFNDVLLTTVLLSERGERSIAIPISQAALQSNRADGLYNLQVSLNGGLSCSFVRQGGVVIRSNSYLALPHQVTAPPTDLRLLPRPIYQRSFLGETAIIVVPDEPTVGDLQAAMVVAAGFGRMSGGELILSLVPASQLSTVMRSNSHLIFVGNEAAFPMLAQVDLPTAPPLGGAEDETAEDGLVRIALSPWSESHVVLAVGGETEAGILKAGQAVSSGDIIGSVEPNIAIVSEVRSPLPARVVPADRTFVELGYGVTTLRGAGTETVDYRFYVPPEQTWGGDAYLDLIYNHSALLSYERSAFIVTLNGEPIGNVAFNDQGEQQGSSRLIIPRSALRSGVNRLAAHVDLVPHEDYADYFDPQGVGVWLTIWPESLLHLPLTSSEGAGARTYDLAAYPELLVTNPTLNNVAFVVPPDSPVAWAVAAQIASDMGADSAGPIAELAVAFGDEIPETLRNERDLLVIGRPSTQPLLQELSETLPGPFLEGSDVALGPNERVVYRVPEGTSIGYLELIPAPWNEDRAVLAILGSTDEGIAWAGNALTTPELSEELAGNFAVVSGDFVSHPDTNADPGMRGLYGPEAQLQPAAPGSAAQRSDGGRPAWILPMIAIALGLMLAIIALKVISTLRRRRSVTS